MIIIMFIGFIIRLIMLLSSKSLWGDEIYSVDWALQSGIQEILSHSLSGTINHPPIYYAILHLFLKIFGMNEIALRLPSFLASLMTIWLVYLIGKKCFHKSVGVTAALLVAVSPYFLQSANEIRPYSIISMLSCLIVLFLIKSFKKKKYLIPYVFLSASITYVEHIGVFVLVATAFYLIVLRRKEYILPWIIIIISQIPWFLMMAGQAVGNEKILEVNRLHEYWNAEWMLKKSFGLFWHFLFGYQFSMITFDKVMEYIKSSPIFWLQALFTIIGLFALRSSLKRLSKKRTMGLHALFVFLCIVPIIFLITVYPIRLDARYLCFAAPFILILISEWLIHNGINGASIILLLFLGMNLYIDVYMIHLKTDSIHKENFKGMIKHVLKNTDSKTAIIDSKYHYRYFVQFLNLDPTIKYFYSPNSIDDKDINKIWLLKEMNMHEDVSKRIIEEDEKIFDSLGFKLKKVEQFGGENGLTVACLYTK